MKVPGFSLVSRIALAVFTVTLAFAPGLRAQEAIPKPSAAALKGLTPEALLTLANEWGMKAEENRMQIWLTSRQLNALFADGSKTVIDMPGDRMAVSLAPYIMKTHPCASHYPTTCRGELPNSPVHVVAVTSDGKTLIDEKTTTLPNGFIDLWLPRDLQVDVTMEARGLKVTQRVGTSDQDPTCITTAKLHY